MSKPVLEPVVQAFADATAQPPCLFQIDQAEGRKAVDDVQSGPIDKRPSKRPAKLFAGTANGCPQVPQLRTP
ncbi:hypothetical protein [Streptosporangium roseum]|uniref:hypothetical protein n=1 Tax=Streptosporangium roseum TaxID=2001 RepID=UPI00342DB88B